MGNHDHLRYKGHGHRQEARSLFLSFKSGLKNALIITDNSSYVYLFYSEIFHTSIVMNSD